MSTFENMSFIILLVVKSHAKKSLAINNWPHDKTSLLILNLCTVFSKRLNNKISESSFDLK